MRTAARLFTEEAGASLTEYAFLLALIALLSVAVLATLGSDVSGVFADARLRAALGY